MQALCSRFLRKMQTAREVRNKNVLCCERSFLMLCVLLLAFGFSMLFTGAGFMSQALWQNGQFGLDGIKMRAGILVVAYVVLTWLLACLGILISCKRDCSVAWSAIYAVLVFFGVVVPLLAEGTRLTKLGELENEGMQTYCEKELVDIHREHNRMVFAFFDFAHRFDKMSAQMLDVYMCTEKCPCLDYGENPSSKEVFASMPEVVARHNRTFDPAVKDKVFMNFTKDPLVGFKSFDACYARWLEKKENDSSIDLDKVFYLDHKQLFSGRPYRPENGHEEHYTRHKAKFVLSHLNEIEMYEDLEDEYLCSGMCKQSLFYFGQDLQRGSPKDTCLLQFKEAISASAQGFASTSILTGVVALFVFLGHFGLYYRPPPPLPNIGRPPAGTGEAVDPEGLAGGSELRNLPTDGDGAEKDEMDQAYGDKDDAPGEMKQNQF